VTVIEHLEAVLDSMDSNADVITNILEKIERENETLYDLLLLSPMDDLSESEGDALMLVFGCIYESWSKENQIPVFTEEEIASKEETVWEILNKKKSREEIIEEFYTIKSDPDILDFIFSMLDPEEDEQDDDFKISDLSKEIMTGCLVTLSELLADKNG